MDPIPFFERLVADAPPTLRSVALGGGDPVCAACGLRGGDRADFRELGVAGSSGAVVCRLCALGWTAAWEPARVRLALIPEWDQGVLNALVIRWAVHKPPSATGGSAVMAGHAVLASRLLEALHRRAEATHREWPITASTALLRQTLRAMPVNARAPVLAELAGLRYLPEPADRGWMDFFHRRRLRGLTGSP
ncbi:MAG: hypothetical protein KDJ31_17775 [Candidatus Competibacteraceae bacterium]|nr:hypothetical protein [Candidatus Competibacteraceae bacterium]MCP5451328.1 hypothetical protein [Gammaproteobacteria bacterium]